MRFMLVGSFFSGGLSGTISPTSRVDAGVLQIGREQNLLLSPRVHVHQQLKVDIICIFKHRLQSLSEGLSSFREIQKAILLIIILTFYKMCKTQQSRRFSSAENI